jgi:hypothetical protein
MNNQGGDRISMVLIESDQYQAGLPQSSQDGQFTGSIAETLTAGL